MTDSTYNGWTNYETWLVALWLDNSEGAQESTREQARECIEDAEGDKDEATYALEQIIKDAHEDYAPSLDGVYADLLNAALSSVDWREIARHYVDDAYDDWAKENAETEESEG